MMFIKSLLLLVLLNIGCAENESPTFKYVTSYLPEGKYMTKDDIQKTSVNVLKPVVFIINDIGAKEDTKGIIDAYLEKQISNVFVVDWNKSDPKEGSSSAQSIGLHVADFVATIFNKTQEPYLNIHLVGILSGFEVASSAGERVAELTGRKVNRITGLDPTYYLINYGVDASSTRAYSKNANFVDVIRFSKLQDEQIAHVDFYVYDETCYNDLKTCDKSTTIKLFAQSVNSAKVKAIKCESLISFQSGNCADGERINFGENVPNDARGKYFLKTTN